MPNNPHYACTRCEAPTKREDLTVKKALFTTMGVGAQTKKARVTDWLCQSCLRVDSDYNREPWAPPRVVNQLAV